MKNIVVKLILSIAYLSQTDCNLECTIGMLDDMIIPYACHLQTDWDQYLDQLEFAYNNSEYTSNRLNPVSSYKWTALLRVCHS
jgi:hypothetical protein